MNFIVSNNRITGVIPGDIFIDSSIQIFGIGQNCFRGTIPESICSAKKLENLLLYTLSYSCSRHHDSAYLTNLFDDVIYGTIPACIFQLPNIQSIYLNSNALKGTIPDDILFSSPRLINISISYNILSGTIPRQVMHSKFTTLDISNNKITGTLEDGITDYRYDENLNETDTVIEFQVNRFSGQPPGATASSYDTVEMTRGNQFSCDIHEIESKDPYSKINACGSANLDTSIYMLSFAMIVTAILAFFYHAKYKRKDNYKRDAYFTECPCKYFRSCVKKVPSMERMVFCSKKYRVRRYCKVCLLYSVHEIFRP